MNAPQSSRGPFQVARGAGVRMVELIRARGPDAADAAFLGLAVVALVLSVYRSSFIFSGHVLTATMIGLSLCFVITSRSLKLHGDVGLERTFIALAALVCAAWLYEFPFHYSWPTALDRLGHDMGTLTRNTVGGGAPWPFWWALIMVCMIFTGIRYMRLNAWFYLFAGLSALTFFLWWATGFPDLFHPQWWPNQRPWIGLIPSEYRHPREGVAFATVALWGGIFNSVTKVLLCITPALLFLPRVKVKEGERVGRLRMMWLELVQLVPSRIRWRRRTGV